MKNKLIVLTRTCAVTYELDGRARHTLKPIADEFDLSVDEFVTRFTCNKLPGQPSHKRGWSGDDELAGLLAKAISKANPAAFARIINASLLTEQSPSELIWASIGSSVKCYEEDMVISPKTGKPIADRLSFTLGEYVVSRVLHSEAA